MRCRFALATFLVILSWVWAGENNAPAATPAEPEIVTSAREFFMKLESDYRQLNDDKSRARLIEDQTPTEEEIEQIFPAPQKLRELKKDPKKSPINLLPDLLLAPGALEGIIVEKANAFKQGNIEYQLYRIEVSREFPKNSPLGKLVNVGGSMMAILHKGHWRLLAIFPIMIMQEEKAP